MYSVRVMYSLKKTKERKERATTIPPLLEWVEKYCTRPGEIEGNRIDPRHFFDTNEAVGWMRGKSKIKNWQAYIRTWEARQEAPAISRDRGVAANVSQCESCALKSVRPDWANGKNCDKCDEYVKTATF